MDRGEDTLSFFMNGSRNEGAGEKLNIIDNTRPERNH